MSESITLFAFAAVLIAIASTFFMVEFLNLARVTLFGSKQRGAPFDPARDLPSLAGKVVLITGAAGDLGRQAAIELARYSSPRRIYVADLPLGDAAKKAVVDNIAREATKGSKGSDESHRQTEIKFLDLDLTSFQSVKRCVADFMAQEERLDILFLNAGIIRVAPGKTKEGYEIHFGLNYVGHALLSRLLLPTLMRTAQKPDADVRVIVVSSEGHAMAPEGGVQFDKVKTDCAALVRLPNYFLPSWKTLTIS
jgi:retinol dehydrogenase-12